MLQFKPQQQVTPDPPENRWSIGIDRRHVAVYVAIALVIGFVIGFISARYNLKKETVAGSQSNQIALNEARAPQPEPVAGEFHRVSRLVRGDTIEIEGSGVVKMIGIETPDGKSPKDLYATHGQNALNYTQKLVNQEVRLEFDPSNTSRSNKDDQGQTLAYVYTRDGLLINGEMVRLGLAFVKGSEQFRKSDQFRALEREAVQGMHGVWGSSGSSTATTTAAATSPPPAGSTGSLGLEERKKLSPLPPSALGPNVPAISGLNATSEATVLVSPGDKMYHKAGCEFLDKKQRSIALSQAKSEGYAACSRCFVSTAMKAP